MRHVPLALTGCLVLALAGCARPVSVAPAPQASAPACASVRWPGALGEAGRVETDPPSPGTAAWAQSGRATIVARCGVAVPGPTSDECIAVDDVDWVAHRLEDGMRFTTYGRSPAVEVLVPRDYAPEPLLLSSFRDAARAGAPTGHRCV